MPGSQVAQCRTVNELLGLLVFLGHSAISYLHVPLSNTLWPFYEPQGHPFFDYLCYWVNALAMPLFFLLAGMSAGQGYKARGAALFLSLRARRLLGPLLLGLLTVVPVTYLVCAYGLLVSGRLTIHQLLRLRLPAETSSYLIGPMHLWFLEYLFLLSVAFLGLLLLGGSLTRRAPAWLSWVERPERLFASAWRPLVPAVPTALLAFLDPHVQIRLHNSFVPDGMRLLHYAVFFLVGAWLARGRDLAGMLVPYSRTYLLCSVPALIVMSPLLARHLVTPLEGPPCWALVVSGTMLTWLSVFGWVGLFLDRCRGRSRVLVYLSEASLWVYFLHMPVVALLQPLLSFLPWPLGIKFALVLLLTAALCLVTYEGWARYTLVGAILNGGRKRRAPGGSRRLALALLVPVCLLVPAAAGAWYSRPILWQHNFHPVVVQQVYRSARLSERQERRAIDRFRLHSVVCLCDGSKVPAERELCESLGVEYWLLTLDPDRPPGRGELVHLVEVIDRCRRPVLLHDRWGLERVGLAAAVAQLVGAGGVQDALGEFSLRYGNVGVSPQAQVVVRYEHWLKRNALAHAPDRFRFWAAHEYQP